MFFVVAIRTDELKIAQAIVMPVSVLVMHVQYLLFTVAASFTSAASLFQQPYLHRPLGDNLITRPSDLVANPCSMFIATCPAAGLFMRAGKDGRAAYYAGCLLSIRKAVARLATERPAFAGVQLDRSPIYRAFADTTLGVRISFVSLSHSSSLPHRKINRCVQSQFINTPRVQ